MGGKCRPAAKSCRFRCVRWEFIAREILLKPIEM
jgi:hypothetical protein